MNDFNKLQESYSEYKKKPLSELAGDHEKVVALVFNKDGIFKSLFSDKYPKDAETTYDILRKGGAHPGMLEEIRKAYRVAFKEVANNLQLPMETDPSFFSGLRIAGDFDKRAFYNDLEQVFKIKLRFSKGL